MCIVNRGITMIANGTRTDIYEIVSWIVFLMKSINSTDWSFAFTSFCLKGVCDTRSWSTCLATGRMKCLCKGCWIIKILKDFLSSCSLDCLSPVVFFYKKNIYPIWKATVVTFLFNAMKFTSN